MEKHKLPRLIKAAEFAVRKAKEEPKVDVMPKTTVSRVRALRDPRARFNSLFDKPAQV